MMSGLPRAVVCDIEGTTGSASHVHQVLFPYARERIVPWLDDRRGTPEHGRVLAGVRAHTGRPDLTAQEAATALVGWLDADVKAPPLKEVQGLIWADGYARGELTGHVYDDVPAALARWARAGIDRYVYSSGSVSAQRNWFAHTAHGDLTGLLCGYFDLHSAGGKRLAASYRTITDHIGVPAGATLFLSDVADELDAAARAGWLTCAVRRPGDPRGDRVAGHVTVADLSRVLAPDPPGLSEPTDPAGAEGVAEAR
ncbi:acireductone synthase [Streptomyces sp. HSW2009]|uniref:acireductone synthase n=1 Tax=Streptomyces sp. HSW2009 TaxID=3142890 RepID=UPI0032F034C3